MPNMLYIDRCHAFNVTCIRYVTCLCNIVRRYLIIKRNYLFEMFVQCQWTNLFISKNKFNNVHSHPNNIC